MGKPYSDDLRERVVAAIEAGHTRVKVAELYNMALSTVRGIIKRKRGTGRQVWRRPCQAYLDSFEHDARTKTARGTRKTMIVALARKLLIALRRLVREGVVPDGVVLRPA